MEKRIPSPPPEKGSGAATLGVQINESDRDPRRGDFRKNKDSLLSHVSAMLGGARFEGYATRFDESRKNGVERVFFFFFPRNFEAENFETKRGV